MSKIKMYGIKDTVGGNFLTPNFFTNQAVALRAISSAVNCGQGSLLSDYPADVQIFELGEFDDQTGIVTPMEPHFICNAIDLKEVQNEN